MLRQTIVRKQKTLTVDNPHGNKPLATLCVFSTACKDILCRQKHLPHVKVALLWCFHWLL